MKIADRIVGYSKNTLTIDPFVRHLIKETQKVKVYQSKNVLPLLFFQMSLYVFFLWDDVPKFNLVFWAILVTISGLYRYFICKKIESKLQNSNAKQIYSNELELFFSSLNNTLVVGSGFWWIGVDGSERAVFAVTLLCCIYAIGTTINSSAKFNNFPILIITNLGQGVLFLAGVGRDPDPVISVGLVGISILLIQFGRRNSEIFSESIQIRDQIRQKNTKLEKDKKIIEQALASAKEANEDKSRFLAAASHDLRQPLHAMTLFLECLRQTNTTPESIDIIEKIEETSNALKNQFNSLLDLSKFDAGFVETNFTEFYFDELLYNIIDGVKEDAKNKNLDLVLEIEAVTVMTDILLTERLIRNIILNAIRYTDQGSILVKTTFDQNGIHLIVKDTGLGIAKTDQEKIFDDFYQTDNPSRTRGEGSGLGLSIVKRISDLLGLQIQLDSTLGVGSTFDVFFPHFNKRVGQVKDIKIVEDKIVEDCVFENLNILIVDDEPTILEALSLLIKSWKCTPYLAHSIQGVREIMDANVKIDFAIIDDMLGKEETGLQLAHLLSTKIKHRPIIVTGNVIPDRLLEIENQGFNVYQKPIDINVLRNELAGVWQKRL